MPRGAALSSSLKIPGGPMPHRSTPSTDPVGFLVEPLEKRRLLAASVVAGALLVEGSDEGDEITVRYTAAQGGTPASFTVTVGAQESVHPAEGVFRIDVRGGGGDDTVTVDVPLPDPVPQRGLPRITVD